MRPDIDALIEVSLANRIRAMRELTERSDDGPRQVPRHKDGDPQGDDRDQQHDPARAGRLVPCSGDSCSGELKMSIADAGRQGDSPTQNRIGLLVVLDQCVAFGRDRNHTV